MRSSVSTVTFSNAFALPGHADELPAGEYEILVEEELLLGLSFEAWRRTATFIKVARRAGRVEMRPITEMNLRAALSRDQAAVGARTDRNAELSPQKDSI